MADPRAVLAAIQQRADAATDGPWQMDTNGCCAMAHIEGDLGFIGGERTMVPADAEFIAASRTDVPRLVAALTAVLDLANKYERDDAEHLDRFGQPHPVAYHPYPRIRAVIATALTEEES